MKSIRNLIVAILFINILSSCSGGGGSDGGSGSSQQDGNKRTTGTGVRILNGSLDSEPLDLKIADKYLSRVGFMEVNYYVGAKSGAQNLILERANSPEVIVSSLTRELLPKTEYSVLVYGDHLKGNFNISTIEEPVVQPAVGEVRVQLVNLLNGSSTITLNGFVNTEPVAFGTTSGFITIPTPANTVQVLSINNSRRTIATVTAEFSDQFENTIVVGGNQDDGVIVTKVFKDLD